MTPRNLLGMFDPIAVGGRANVGAHKLPGSTGEGKAMALRIP
jgi:hypothetical protein